MTTKMKKVLSLMLCMAAMLSCFTTVSAGSDEMKKPTVKEKTMYIVIKTPKANVFQANSFANDRIINELAEAVEMCTKAWKGISANINNLTIANHGVELAEPKDPGLVFKYRFYPEVKTAYNKFISINSKPLSNRKLPVVVRSNC